MSDQTDSIWMRVVVDVVTRLIYFCLAFCGALFGPYTLNRHRTPWVPPENLISRGPHLYIALAFGVLAAIVGPFLYNGGVMRGRGDLKKTKDMSRRR
jgi:hypothetical protein